MEIIAFVGPAGTGKSDRALTVAYENQCGCIIDDGILIYRSRIVAGTSAKREDSPIAAVRRAIFEDKDQARSVSVAIRKISPHRILILGTSERMISKITEALGIPAPVKTIHIEDIAGPEEMREAHKARHQEGKHIIPVPTMELRPQFKGYMIVPIKSLLNRRQGKGSAEKSVVRPSFSYYGKLRFGRRVFHSLTAHALRNLQEEVTLQKVTGIRENTDDGNGGLTLTLSLTIRCTNPQKFRDTIDKVRRLVQREIENTTGMTLEKIKFEVTTDVMSKPHTILSQ